MDRQYIPHAVDLKLFKPLEDDFIKELREGNFKDNKDKFNSEIFSEKNKQKYGTQLLDEFYLFYSEPTQDGKKMKFQTFDTWSTAGRLATWSKKDYNGYYKLHRDELFRRGQNKPKPIVDESELDPQGLNDYMKKLSKQIGRS